MIDPGRPRWLVTAILVGGIYFVLGLTPSVLPASSHTWTLVWRWLAFLLSGVAFAAHIAYEHFRLGNRARKTAWHASVAVALGGFALALAANLHDLGSASGYRPRMLIALAAWPLLTAVPAFLVALAVAAGLGLKQSHL